MIHIALERRTTKVSGTFSENWADAPNGTGSPGSANNVAGDETPPFFDTVTAQDAATLKLEFSEKITGIFSYQSAELSN
ncbi:MAG: hypothetical protein U5J63_16245 [Fodinibius sp.]|nr:hypothetical protein [Fodinibius sp.]